MQKFILHRVIFVVIFLATAFNSLMAQSKQGLDAANAFGKTTFRAGLNGQIAFSTDLKAKYYFANMSGPNVVFEAKNFKIGVSLYPSLSYHKPKNSDKYILGTNLGVGPIIHIKNLVLIAPFYYIGDEAKWTPTFGLGYTLNSIKF